MKRRGFLGAVLAAGVAPAFVGSKILMPVRALALPPYMLRAGDAGRTLVFHDHSDVRTIHLPDSGALPLGTIFVFVNEGINPLSLTAEGGTKLFGGSKLAHGGFANLMKASKTQWRIAASEGLT